MESMVEQILQEKKISEPEVISKETTWKWGEKIILKNEEY